MSSDSDEMLRSHGGGVAVASEPEPTTDESTEAVVLSSGGSHSDKSDPAELQHLPFAEARALALEQFDRQFLGAALARHNGNIARTARALGLHRQSLQKLMARRNIKAVRS